MLAEALGAIGSIAGGLLGNKSAEKAAKKNYQQQKEFAQNSIQWRVADGQKAGINKLVAAGAQPSSYAPSNVGGNFDFLGNAGQNIGRAMVSGSSPSGQTNQITKMAGAVQLEGLQLDNDIKRAQIASMARTITQPGTAQGAGGPYAIPGQPGAERIFSTKTDVASPTDAAVVPGRTPEVLLTDTVSGGYAPVLPPALQEALESQGVLAQAQYFIRNGLLPAFSDAYRPKEMRAGSKPGYHHRYNPITGEYHEYKTPPYHNPRGR